jgi:hypothetical protein
MSYIYNILQYYLSARMSSTTATPPSPLQRVLLERVLRMDLALEGVRLQAVIHHGLLGGEVDDLEAIRIG